MTYNMDGLMGIVHNEISHKNKWNEKKQTKKEMSERQMLYVIIYIQNLKTI